MYSSAYLWRDCANVYIRVFPCLTATNFLEWMFIGFIYFLPHPTNRIKFVFITFLESVVKRSRSRLFFFLKSFVMYVRLKMRNSQSVYHCHVLFVTCLNECVCNLRVYNTFLYLKRCFFTVFLYFIFIGLWKKSVYIGFSVSQRQYSEW